MILRVPHLRELHGHKVKVVVAPQVLQVEVRRSDKDHRMGRRWRPSVKVRRLDKVRSFLQELHSGLKGQVGQQVRQVGQQVRRKDSRDNKASVGCHLLLSRQTATTACLSNSGFGQ